MIKLTFIQILLLASFISYGQSPDTLPTENNILKKQIQRVNDNQDISADSAFNILSNWNEYPVIKNTKKWYFFFIKIPSSELFH